jgi:hypothetical protein
MKKVTFRGAEFEAVREYRKVQNTHTDELWKAVCICGQAPTPPPYVFVRKEEAYKCRFLEIAEHLKRGWGSKAFSGKLVRALLAPKRENIGSFGARVQGELAAFGRGTDSCVPNEQNTGWSGVYTSEGWCWEKATERFGVGKPRTADRAAHAAGGASSKKPRLNELHQILKRVEFVNRDFNAVKDIRCWVVLKTRPGKLTRANFVGQLFQHEMYKEKLKPIAGEPVEEGWAASAREDVCIPSMAVERFFVLLSVHTVLHPRQI